MGYSSDSAMVRVDFFRVNKEWGTYKWYTTEAVPWITWRSDPSRGGKLIHDAFKEALSSHLQGRLSGMLAICLEPCYEHAHPIAVVVV